MLVGIIWHRLKMSPKVHVRNYVCSVTMLEVGACKSWLSHKSIAVKKELTSSLQDWESYREQIPLVSAYDSSQIW